MTVKKLGENSLFYAVSTLLRFSVMFLLVPVYTANLTVSQFGALETINVTVQSLLIFLSFGLSNALMRYYVECKDEQEVFLMIRSAGIIILFLSIGIFLISFPYLNVISTQLLRDEGKNSLIFLAFAWAIGGAFNELLFAYYRARQEAKTYTYISGFFFLLLISLNISFVQYLDLGIDGILMANCITVWSINLLLPFKFLSKGNVSKYWMYTLLQFGLPLIFSRFGWLVLNSADRYFLGYFRNLEEVAIYSLGYKVGLIVQTAIIVPFQLGWGPYIFTKFSTNDEESLKDFSLIFTYLLFGFSWVGLFLIVFAEEMIYFLGSNNYPQATHVVPFVIFAYLFSSIYYWAGNLLHLAKKTTLLSTIVFAMALINLLLNYLLVPSWGWLASAFVTIISIGGTGLLTLAISQQFIKVPLQRKRIWKLCLNVMIISILFLFTLQIPDIIMRMVGKALLVALFPLLFIGTGFFTMEEMNLFNSYTGIFTEYFRQRYPRKK